MKEELIKKAKDLGLDAEKFGDDEGKLETAIKEKEEENKRNSDPEYLRSEAKKAFDARDKAKADARKLSEKVQKLEEQLSKSPKQEDYEKITQELNELREKQTELDKIKEEEELKSKTETEKLEISFKKQMDRLKADMDSELKKSQKALDEYREALKTKEGEVDSHRQYRLKAEIIEVATKLKAYSPSQIYKLLRDEFQYDKDLDKFVNYVKDGKGKLTDEKSVEEVVKEFLSDPDNDNLVEADVRGGSGHREEDGKSTQKKKEETNRNESDEEKDIRRKYSVTDPKLKEQADERGMKVEDWIDILVMRDLKKLKSNKK